MACWAKIARRSRICSRICAVSKSRSCKFNQTSGTPGTSAPTWIAAKRSNETEIQLEQTPANALGAIRGVSNHSWGRQGALGNSPRFHRRKSALWLWNFLCCSDADSDGRSGFCGEIRSRAVLGVLLRVEQKPTFDADPYLQSAEVASGGCAAARRTRRTAAAAWTMMRPFATGPHQTRLVLGVTWVVGHDSGV